ncbi:MULTISPECIES: hypothetical protein [Microbacterium]|uniref:DUF6907 domain-containing protein n=1 Tax=Microbacterium TaxID=33882 RepID=UPI0027826A03|nr:MULTISPECIES: hypothetical protein [Microbacterium]MDQ1076207.1 hypothetical protein [Microbacterium sp. SORGH_AS_0969]MDQ1116444.1 hypothetical protein [Microbacterium testaceum]
MTPSAPDASPECPVWCAGHEDEQEPTPARWHRSDGIVVSVTERRRAPLGGDPAPLFADDFVVAIEQDAQATYLYIGSLEDGRRFFAVTLDSAQRLQAVISAILCAAK